MDGLCFRPYAKSTIVMSRPVKTLERIHVTEHTNVVTLLVGQSSRQYLLSPSLTEVSNLSNAIGHTSDYVRMQKLTLTSVFEQIRSWRNYRLEISCPKYNKANVGTSVLVVYVGSQSPPPEAYWRVFAVTLLDYALSAHCFRVTTWDHVRQWKRETRAIDNCSLWIY